MAGAKAHHLLRQVRQLVAAQATHGLPDRELLERFVRARDEAAFAALVERHGAMVLSVCRRVLHHVHDAEDACQAAFLVLARRAGAIRRRDSLASWLHGVAFRVASELRRVLLRRRAHEGPAADRAEPDAAADVSWREVQAALDEELGRLPERYRAPLVLCYLEGRTRDEAACQLGWSTGSLRGRLERGRQLLRGRLVRRGLTLSAGLLGTALAEGASPAAMPAALAVATTRAAALVASGGSVSGLVSTQVTLLTQGVLKAMFLTKIKIATAVLAGVVLVSAGAGGVTHRLFAAGQPGGDQAQPLAAQVNEQKAPAEKQQDREKELDLLEAARKRQQVELERAQQEAEKQLSIKLQRVEAENALLRKQLDALSVQLAKVNDVLAQMSEANAVLRKELQGKGAVTAAPTALEQAREEVEVREAQLEVQRAALFEVETRIDGVKRYLKRVEQLPKATISLEEMEKARSQLENLQAQYKVKMAETKVAEVQLKHAKQRLARLEEKKP